ncbi:MAG: helix-turn-helix domain-containing protein [bacterium]|nr:helix-turn-helix domain-containing protein [bacterium]
MKFYNNKLKYYRKAKLLTIIKLAEHLNKSRKTIANWEQGRTIPTKSDIIALALVLDLKISDISDFKDMSNILSSTQLDNLSNNNIPTAELVLKEKLINSLMENSRLERDNIRAHALLNSINSIIYVKDTARKLRRFNKQFLNFLPYDYTPEDIYGKTMIDIFGRMEIEDVINIENMVFKTGELISNEKIRIPGSKGNKYGLISVQPIFDKKNNIIEIVASIKDISDLLEANKKQNQLITVVNYLNDCLWITSNPPYKYEFISKGIKVITGREQQEFISNPNLWFDLIINHNRTPDDDYGKSNPYPGTHILKILQKNGTVKDVECNTYKIKDRNKTLWYGIAREVKN